MDKDEFYIQDMNTYILNEKEKLNKEIGEKLRKKRLERKISAVELAQYTNTSSSYINEIEKGKYNISLLRFILLCNSLEINIAEFLDEFIFTHSKSEDVLYEKLQENKNISYNILEFMKEKK